MDRACINTNSFFLVIGSAEGQHPDISISVQKCEPQGSSFPFSRGYPWPCTHLRTPPAAALALGAWSLTRRVSRGNMKTSLWAWTTEGGNLEMTWKEDGRGGGGEGEDHTDGYWV